MKTVKNLTTANVRNIEGFNRNQEYDFEDDGNRFRGFDYRGLPVTVLSSEGTVYLSIRVDYIINNHQFTYKEWMETEEYKLEWKYNGVSQFDIDELVQDLEKVLVRIAQMDRDLKDEGELDIEPVRLKAYEEIDKAEDVLNDFKKNFDWFNCNEYKLKSLIGYAKSLERDIENAKKQTLALKDADRKERKERLIRLDEYKYVFFQDKSFYQRELLEALGKEVK